MDVIYYDFKCNNIGTECVIEHLQYVYEVIANNLKRMANDRIINNRIHYDNLR